MKRSPRLILQLINDCNGFVTSYHEFFAIPLPADWLPDRVDSCFISGADAGKLTATESCLVLPAIPPKIPRFSI